MRNVLIVGVFVALGCGSGTNNANVATTPADGGCPSENGAVACNTIVGAICARTAMCCNAAGPNACASWAYTTANCVGYYAAHNLDCAAPSRTSISVCTADANRCAGDIPLIACSDFTGGTANLPASCN